MYWNDVLTVPVNVGNVTAISVPAGISDQGLPLGLQLIAPTLAEDRLFQFGHVIEQCTTMPSLPFSLSVTQE
jgi:aspartyl-tRNA(Asn)/glutamyl-tRNA(Gln) amidotransferase subunit A